MSLFTINSSNAASELFKLSSEVYVNQIADSLRIAQNALAARANKELSKPAVDFNDPRLSRPQAERDKLAADKAAFVDEATLMTSVVNQLNRIQATLVSLKAKLASLSSSSSASDRQSAAAELDEDLRIVNGYANNAGDFGKNPIGRPQNANFKVADVITSAGSSGGLYIPGKFSGSDFTITDSNGKTWSLDRSTQTLNQYDSWPDQGAGASYAGDDVSIDSYDESTGAITLNTPGGQVSGTVQKFGVGMLDSFFYNDFASDSDIARAQADVDSALAKLAINQATFGGAAATLNGYLNGLNTKINNLDTKISDVTKQMIDERGAADKALKTKIQIQQQMLALTVNSSGAMVDLFFRGDIKTGSILDSVK